MKSRLYKDISHLDLVQQKGHPGTSVDNKWHMPNFHGKLFWVAYMHSAHLT